VKKKKINWKKKIGNCIKKIWNWFCKEWLLIISILIPIALLLISFYFNQNNKCYSFDSWLKENLSLNFYHLFFIVGAMITLLWTNKRYKHSQKQYKQTEDTIFKNKVNTIYLEVIKLLSDEKTKKEPAAANLINSIQVSIETHYHSAEEIKKAQYSILNFQSISFYLANLNDANLTGANLTGANLSYAEFSKAKLEGANLEGADLKDTYWHGNKLEGANFKGAKNIPKWIKDKLDEDGRYRE